jgi:hypothetical protein
MSQPDWMTEILNRLDPATYEDWLERASIMEFDAGLSRDHAECLALICIARHWLLKNIHLIRNNQH